MHIVSFRDFRPQETKLYLYIFTPDLHNVVNMKLDSGWTPLIHACFHAQDKIVKFLLDLEADPNLHAGRQILKCTLLHIKQLLNN